MEQATFPNQISELQAIELAESVIEGSVVEMELDVENGNYVLALKTSNGKAKIELNAITGEILKLANSCSNK